MPGVSRKDLVSAHAAEDDGQLLASCGTDQIGADRSRVCDWLIHVPYQTREQLRHLGLHDPLVIVDREHALAISRE